MPQMPGMPDDMPDKLEAEVRAKLAKFPRARTAFPYPMVGRAVNKVEKTNPDFSNVDVSVDPWDNRYSGSSTLARTGIDDNKVQLNPVLTAFPQGLTESTLIHELQHVRQNNVGNADNKYANLGRFAKELSLPYEERPSEREAMQASLDYNKKMGIAPNPTWNADPQVFEGFPFASRRR